LERNRGGRSGRRPNPVISGRSGGDIQVLLKGFGATEEVREALGGTEK